MITRNHFSMLHRNKTTILVGLLIVVNSFFWFGFLQKRNHEIIWKRNLFADGSGYFSYLPATFFYGFSESKLEEKFAKKIDEHGEIDELGRGFRIENGKIVTKYFYGIALLQAPIYICVHLYGLAIGYNGDGFNGIYENTTIISSVIYYILALVMLYKLLQKKTNRTVALASILFTVFSTNVIYYFAAYPAYSHAYLFFLFSAFLYFASNFSKRPSAKNALLLYAIAGLIVVTRPIHAVFLLAFFIDNGIERFKQILRPKILLAGLLILFVIIFPQLLYYKYISGNWFHYSYGNESFINLSNPSISKLLFSAQNGLFIYNPIWFVFLLASIWLAFTKYRRLALISLGLFAVNTYLCASWHMWNFGCGYGSRNFVEYAALFSIPFAHILQELHSRWKLFAIIAVSIIFCSINQICMHNYDKCYFGKNDWDFKYVKEEYLRIK